MYVFVVWKYVPFICALYIFDIVRVEFGCVICYKVRLVFVCCFVESKSLAEHVQTSGPTHPRRGRD